MTKHPEGFVDRVQEFHQSCGYTHEPSPSVNDAQRRELWKSLIVEETDELVQAIERADLVAVCDGLADVLYVCIGASLAFGLPIGAIFEEVHRSNMSKTKG